MRCRICDRKKGKRFCPAKNGYICAQCCGEKRVVEIDCPSDCIYLAEGRRYESDQKYSRMFRDWDEFRKQELVRLAGRFGDLFQAIEKYVLENRKVLGRDESLLEAFDLIEKGLQTEARGILYRPSASSLTIETAARELESIIETRRNTSDFQHERLTNSDAASIVRILKDEISFHRSSGSSYMEFLARSRAEQGEPSRLIIP